MRRRWWAFLEIFGWTKCLLNSDDNLVIIYKTSHPFQDDELTSQSNVATINTRSIIAFGNELRLFGSGMARTGDSSSYIKNEPLARLKAARHRSLKPFESLPLIRIYQTNATNTRPLTSTTHRSNSLRCTIAPLTSGSRPNRFTNICLCRLFLTDILGPMQSSSTPATANTQSSHPIFGKAGIGAVTNSQRYWWSSSRKCYACLSTILPRHDIVTIPTCTSVFWPQASVLYRT